MNPRTLSGIIKETKRYIQRYLSPGSFSHSPDISSNFLLFIYILKILSIASHTTSAIEVRLKSLEFSASKEFHFHDEKLIVKDFLSILRQLCP